MTLSDRLAKAKKERFEEPPPAESRSLEETIAARHSRKKVDPFAELKRAVHQTLLEALGPKLYDVTMTQTELEAQVRATLQEVLANQETPLTVAEHWEASPRRSVEAFGSPCGVQLELFG